MNTKPKIACAPNGPYYLIYGEAPYAVPYLRRADGGECTTVDKVALCRCGGSKSKPFCDGTHSRIGFSDKRLTNGSNDKRRSYAGQLSGQRHGASGARSRLHLRTVSPSS